MLACAKDLVFWHSMRKQLHELYGNCTECSLYKLSKSRPDNEVSQKNLFDNFFPNSFLQGDFLEYHSQDYMTMVDT